MRGPSGDKRLFLIDGYALIYRAFFAMIARPLRTSRGENTSAVWGVANFLHRLVAEHDPELVAWVHDAGTSFRTDRYPEYKATREKLDDELQEDFDRSLERVETLLEAFGIPLVAVEGFEADDVIGTLAARAANAGIGVVIVSGDKDFYQLIAPGVSLLNPGRGGPAAVDEQWVDVSNAAERFGVPPERVVDYLALVGDSSDNVPGVRGVGDKTARQLVQQFGDLEAILSRAGEVKGKRAREALLREPDRARLSRDLVTIRLDVPVEQELEGLVRRLPDAEVLERLYTELEFQSLVGRLEAPAAEEASPAPRRPVLVCELAGLEHAVAELRRARSIGLSVVLSGDDPMRAALVGLAAATSGGRSWYFPFAHGGHQGELGAEAGPPNLPPLGSDPMRPLAGLLEDAGVMTVGHDVKRACIALRRAGVESGGPLYDVMLASYVLDPGRRSYALDLLVLDHLGVRATAWESVVGKGRAVRAVADIHPDETAAYGCEVAGLALRLRDVLHPQLEEMGLDRLLSDLEHPLVRVLVEMEWRGIALDRARLAELATRFERELRDLEARIHEEAGVEFNINSTPQLRHVLFDKLGLPVVKKTKTGPSTDADVLATLTASGFVLPTLLLEYRELSKLQSTYVEVLPASVHPETRRIHTRFSQVGAATGRLASSEPNLQNIPIRTARGEEIRRCFVPGPHHRFVVADYSQVELRLLAHLSEDADFIQAFRTGGDIHKETAARIFEVPVGEVTAEMRARAKTINFATIYGQGPFALSRQLEISQDEAKEFIARYFERFAGVRRFLDGCVEVARDRGYVETLFGRRRYVPELKDRNYNIRAFGERVAMNSPLQGSAADLIKRAMIGLDGALREEGLSGALLLQVHDELVLEVPVEAVDRTVEVVRREMETAAALRVPLVVDIGVGPNWLEAKG